MQLAEISLYLISLLLGGVGAWIVAKHGNRFGLLDTPNSRSSHQKATPRGGGIGIVVAFLTASLIQSIPTSFWVSGVFLACLSFVEDREDVHPRVRLILHFGAAIAFLMFFGGWTNHLDVLILMILFSIFIVGTTNFYNFMDGIDGIAAITGVIAFGFISYYSSHYLNNNAPYIASLAACLSFACLGFLPFNMRRTKVFMGDVGSILLGFAFSTMVAIIASNPLDFLCCVSFLFPFYADELTTMFVRIKDGENLLLPHRRHLYQLLANEKRVPHWQVSASFGFIQFVVAASVLTAKNHGTIAVLSVLAGYSLAFGLVSFYFRSTLEGPRPVEAA